MQVSVLGPVRAVVHGAPVELGSPKQRAVLAALALHAGRPVSADALESLLWGEAPPEAVAASLQTYVAGLRRALEPGRAARSPSSLLATTSQGYVLHLPDGGLDATRFVGTVQRLHRRIVRPSAADGVPLPPTGLDGSELAALRAELDAALGLWTGIPYADLRDDGAVLAERARLEDLRLVAVEDLALVRLALGEHATVAADLEGPAHAHPLRESLWAVRVLALARAGRQGEALDALRAIRGTLAEELGIDPGPALQALETAVLRQAPEVTGAPPAGGPARATPKVATPAARGERAPGVAGGTETAGGTEREPDGDPGGLSRPWPLVGRRAQLAALEQLLGPASAGTPGLAVVVGEPGVGKTRLVQELAARARTGGFAVLQGRCSQDEGAPPLWPWVLLLRDLPRAVPEAGPVGADVLAPHEPPGEGPGGSDAARFRVWDAVVELLVAAATHRPLLVVLDDLHWADASSLRLLRHLVESVGSARLVVVGTRRARPLPTGPLAQAGESMARRGAVRVDLAGLEPADVGSLVQATTGRRPSGDEAALLARRTGGNAFFVTELARLPAGRLDAEVPAAVTDVVRARLQHLPEESQDVLRTAAVVGRRFDVALVAAAAGVREDDVLDRLDPALEAGLVADDGAEAFRFSHAIVRDAVYAAVPASRRARRHAAVADALDSRRVAPSGTARSEAARHWLAAGPAHTARAWPAAARAADEAGAMLAHEEAVELLAAAVQAQRSDPAATALDRYDLLMAHAEACRRVADRETLDEVVLAAVAQADLLGDDDRLARAAVATVDGAVWLTRYYGEVNQPLVDALHRSLARVPPHDSELRCRVLLALAVELYYAAAPREREALVEQGLAMARRLGDPRLLVWACTAAFTAIWRGETAPERYRIAREALDAAERGGDATHLALARTLLSIASLETGRIDRMRAETAAARALAERLRLPYHLVVLGLLEVPWLALEGRLEAAERLLAETSALMQRTSMPARNESPAAAALVLLMAQDRIESDALPMILTVADASAMPLEPSVLALLTRAGRIEQARERYASRGGMHLDHDTWLTPLCLCLAAEAALALELRDVAAEVYGRLAPLAGRPCSGGSGAALGPVDGFLALAALAAGEPAVATRHADDAARLCAEWGVPVAARWLEGHRERAGF